MAAGAVSVPIIIHLLNRRRFRIVVWAAMRFLLNAQKQNTKRMRLEQIVLLAVRCLIILLVVLAMASATKWAEDTIWAAWWPDGSGVNVQRAGRVHHLLVIDGSLSMSQREGGKSAFERAVQLAADKVRSCPAGNGFSVLLLKDNPTWIIGEIAHDSRKVAREIEALKQSHGNSGTAAALNMVSAKLAENAGRFPTQVVYFFTDMQRATWLAPPPAVSASAEVKAPKDGEGKQRQVHEEIQARARTAFIDVGHDGVGNVAVSDVRVDDAFVITDVLTPITFTVTNHSEQERVGLRVELMAARAREGPGDAAMDLRVVDMMVLDTIPPGGQKTDSFKHRFPKAGTYALKVRVRGDEAAADNLEADDMRSLVLTVRDTIPVLLVNGKPAADRYDRSTEYLRMALQPFPPRQEPKFAPLRPKVVSAIQFADMQEHELAEFDAIYLCDLANFGGAELRRLEGHLRRGGGVVLSLGDQAADNLDVYNRLLYKSDIGLLPARLTKKISAPKDHYFTLHAQESAFEEPPLKAFADDDDRISLRSGRFRQYIQAKVGSDARVRTILSFMPEVTPLSEVKVDATLPTDDPAVLEWNPPLPRPKEEARLAPRGKEPPPRQVAPVRYRGKVILVASTLNMDWTSWPGSPSYGALMQELARLAVSGKLRGHAGMVGNVLEEYLPVGGGEVEATVHYPTDYVLVPRAALQAGAAMHGSALKPARVRTQLQDDVNIFRFTDTDLAGVYRAVMGNSPQEYPFAVNPPASTPDQRDSESNLVRVDAAKLQEHYPGWEVQVLPDAKQVTVVPAGAAVETQGERGDIGPYIARGALLIALGLILAEVLLAWRFGHYSAVAGATAQPATGLALPITIAAVALVIFGLGAYVLFQSAESGDFLSFLPDSWRGGLESAMKVNPAPPGEGTRWDLEQPLAWLPPAIDDGWFRGILVAGLILFVVLIYWAEAPLVHPAYKLLLGALRLFLIFLAIWVLLPQLQLKIDRQGWPDVVILVDDSRSMGEPDHYQDEGVRERAKKLSDSIKKRLLDELPAKIQAQEKVVLDLSNRADKDDALKADLERNNSKLQSWKNLKDQMNSPNWRASRLQLAQALLAQPDKDWLSHMLSQRRMKVHLYHLDAAGRAVKLTDADGAAGELTDHTEGHALPRAHKALARLEAEGMDSRLGTAVRQVIDQYRGGALSGVIMFTDGVTTRDETIGQVAEFAAQKGVPLFFIGIGDDHEIKDLKLHDLQVEDVVYVNDRVVFEARVTGQGYKDKSVDVVLKLKGKDGKEKELDRTKVKIDPTGKSVKVRLRDQPKEVGRRPYVLEVEDPKAKRDEKASNVANLRLERTIEVIEAKMIRVLYVEGQPRYEFRFIKSLLERESPDGKKNKTVDLKVVLLDADDDFVAQDKTALRDFPQTREELEQFDVVILGDVDPKHPKLGGQRLQQIADFVRGEDKQGKKSSKTGGGLLFLAGPFHNPHSYKDTPLADVLPVESLGKNPAEPEARVDRLRLELTPVGRMHPIFRFSPDEAENQAVWQKLAPMFWHASGYRLRPLAEVLAVHPSVKGDSRDAGQDPRLPLVVQQFVGSGRCMFFGFEETWRWRYREDEVRFNQFWIQTVRYLSRTRQNRTDLRLDRQTPYRLGEPIKVTVRFPDNAPGQPQPADPKAAPKLDVKVIVEYRPGKDKDGPPVEPEVQTLQLTKVEGSWGSYEAILTRTREGKYRFWLSQPDVSKNQPDGEKPSAEAIVELPPGELDRLRMNQQELTQAAEASGGKFYTLVNADDVLTDLPGGARVSLNTPRPPIKLWNQWPIFLLVLGLLGAEWFLRKRKHLL